MKKKIAIIGASGFAREILQLLQQVNSQQDQWEILGFFDDIYDKNTSQIINGFPILGKVADVNRFHPSLHLIVAIGNTETFKLVIQKINLNLFTFPNIIHPAVQFDFDSNKIGIGNIVTAGCIFTCNIEIGNFNSFNTYTCVGHDVRIGNFNVFGPKVQISGNVKIGNDNQLGLCSGILQNKKVGSNNRIGAYTFIYKNVSDNTSYFGIPAVKHQF